jgi:hypothetical protein
MNLIRRLPQSDFIVPYATVLRRIVQGLLQNSEETKGAQIVEEAKPSPHHSLGGDLVGNAYAGGRNWQTWCARVLPAPALVGSNRKFPALRTTACRMSPTSAQG